MKNPFKAGDKVRIKDEPNRTYTVYAVYTDNNVSLGIYRYPEAEQDYLINISELILVKKAK